MGGLNLAAQSHQNVLTRIARLYEFAVLHWFKIGWHFFPAAAIDRWMHDATDMDLLRQYAAGNSDTTFAALVLRHVDLVYSAALRKTGNPHAAEEITQVVFIILAQKAGRILDKTILPGWLYQTARLTASSFLRRETRRVRREQEAYMQTELDTIAPDETWEQLAPLLEDAMGQLGDKDRAAVVLRFFGGKSFSEVASAAGVSENAAKKRVSHALEKLQRYFSKRGVSSTTAIIAGAISTHSVHAAPVTLAKTISAIAVAKGAAASGSTLTLIKGALKIMAWTKAKTVVVASVAVLLATGTTVVVVEKVVSPTVDESFWEMKSENLDKAPSVLIIRPTRYYKPHTSSMMRNDDEGKVIAQNIGVIGLLQEAYSIDQFRMILPASVPTNNFDLMLTLRSQQKEALQKVIQRKFGFTAHRETRETDVLVLTVIDSGLLALHASKQGSKMDFKAGNGLAAFSNFPISSEAQMLESCSFKPVILQPGLSGNYDITFQWEYNPQDAQGMEQALSNELAQAGLELVPSRKPIEMLVVEKVK